MPNRRKLRPENGAAKFIDPSCVPFGETGHLGLCASLAGRPPLTRQSTRGPSERLPKRCLARPKTRLMPSACCEGFVVSVAII